MYVIYLQIKFNLHETLNIRNIKFSKSISFDFFPLMVDRDAVVPRHVKITLHLTRFCDVGTKVHDEIEYIYINCEGGKKEKRERERHRSCLYLWMEKLT